MFIEFGIFFLCVFYQVYKKKLTDIYLSTIECTNNFELKLDVSASDVSNIFIR